MIFPFELFLDNNKFYCHQQNGKIFSMIRLCLLLMKRMSGHIYRAEVFSLLMWGGQWGVRGGRRRAENKGTSVWRPAGYSSSSVDRTWLVDLAVSSLKALPWRDWDGVWCHWWFWRLCRCGRCSTDMERRERCSVDLFSCSYSARRWWDAVLSPCSQSWFRRGPLRCAHPGCALQKSITVSSVFSTFRERLFTSLLEFVSCRLLMRPSHISTCKHYRQAQ